MVRYEKLKEFVASVAGEFGVPVPGVVVVRDLRDKCNCAGLYDPTGKTIYLDDRVGVNLDVVLHELAHHIQYVVFKEVFDGIEWSKPHCERSFEAEAKAFAKTLKWYYENLWSKVVEGVG